MVMDKIGKVVEMMFTLKHPVTAVHAINSSTEVRVESCKFHNNVAETCRPR